MPKYIFIKPFHASSAASPIFSNFLAASSVSSLFSSHFGIMSSKPWLINSNGSGPISSAIRFVSSNCSAIAINSSRLSNNNAFIFCQPLTLDEVKIVPNAIISFNDSETKFKTVSDCDMLNFQSSHAVFNCCILTALVSIISPLCRIDSAAISPTAAATSATEADSMPTPLSFSRS